MRVLVTGANGQLGSDLMLLLAERPEDAAMGVDLPDIDISDPASVQATFDGFAPDVVINCAAWTAVDLAEEREADALRVNGDGPGVLARACASHGAWLVQISTDYVFDGRATSPYPEDAAPDPRSAYGRTKLAGELAVRQALPEASYLVRTAWLYGVRGQNFVKTILRLLDERETVSVVDDQRGQPTYARDLARQILLLLDARPPSGTFHATNSGEVTWYGFTLAICEEAGIDPARVIATDSSTFIRPAPRPAYSVLGHDGWSRSGLPAMRDWREGLAAAFADGIESER
jgi:dTDP-4-dehydrorhamnose reductase